MLDKKRSYGTICGVASIPGAKYDQDGKVFNMLGEELDAAGNVIVELPKEPPPAKKDVEPLKVRVYELAKRFDMVPTDLVNSLRDGGFEIGNHMTVLDDEAIKWATEKYATTITVPAGETIVVDSNPTKPKTIIIGGGK